MSQIKLIIAGIILAVIAIVAGVLVWQHHEVTTLTQAAATDTATIADQAQSVSEAHATVETQIKSAAITEATQVQAASEVAASGQTVAKIATTQLSQEQEVAAAYAKIPVKGKPAAKGTVAPKPAAKVITVGKTTIDTSKVSEADAMSTVRVTSMWDTYCQLNPDQADPAACLANE